MLRRWGWPRANHAGRGVWWWLTPRLTALGFPYGCTWLMEEPDHRDAVPPPVASGSYRATVA